MEDISRFHPGERVRYIEPGGRNQRSGRLATVVVMVCERKGGQKALLEFDDGYRMTVPGSCIRSIS
jgi:hypothetical protein